MKTRIILPIIVIAQFACGSLWFASNGVMYNLQETFHLADSALGHLTSFVQFGFIAGTLIFAFLTISDRFSPSKVFFTCAILGAIFNVSITLEEQSLTSLLVFRFLTGLCCLLSPYVFELDYNILILFMLTWGMFVVADSPQFSALVAKYAESKTRGTALTIVNSIGFAITIVSIQLLNNIVDFIEIKYIFLILVIGPIFEIYSMNKLEVQNGPN